MQAFDPTKQIIGTGIKWLWELFTTFLQRDGRLEVLNNESHLQLHELTYISRMEEKALTHQNIPNKPKVSLKCIY